MLEPGTEAPDFDTTTLRGSDVNLRRWRGTPVWLAFFRFASCPLCNFRVHTMIELWQQFRGRDFAMLAIFQSPRSRLDEFVAEQAPEFDLVADPEMKLYQLYGLETSWLGAMHGRSMSTGMKAKKAGFPLMTPSDGPLNRMPGDYLIDRDGQIVQVFRGKSIADHIPLEQVDHFLQSQGV